MRRRIASVRRGIAIPLVLLSLAAGVASCGGHGRAAGSPSPAANGRAAGGAATMDGGSPALRGEASPAAGGVYDLRKATGAGPAPASVPAGARTDYRVPSFASLAARFAYDRGKPLRARWSARATHGSVTVTDLSYWSVDHVVHAWLVLPRGRGPFPCVVYAHAYGGDRGELLGEAQNRLGPRGVAGLLVGFPGNLWSFDAAHDCAGWVSWIVDLRRGIDLLERLPRIDARRLGFVGSGQGAAAGAILSGLDHRIRSYSLISCPAYFNDAVMFDGPGPAAPRGAALGRFLRRMFALSPLLYVRHAGRSSFLFLDSDSDPSTPAPYARALLAAVPGPKRLSWHDGGRIPPPTVFDLQDRWLLRGL